jgi:shikimate kinase
VYRLKKTVALVGMMGAGKTAIGNACARYLGVPFLDSDTEIEKAAGLSIAEIFERYDETFFREKECQVIARLLDGEPGILSTGGGAYLNGDIREMISSGGVAVWLQADPDLLWSRVRHKNTRPLLRTANPRAKLEQLCTERTPFYAKAEIAVEGRPRYSIPQMTEKVVTALLARSDVLVKEDA